MTLSRAEALNPTMQPAGSMSAAPEGAKHSYEIRNASIRVRDFGVKPSSQHDALPSRQPTAHGLPELHAVASPPVTIPVSLKAPRIDPHETVQIRCSRPTRQDAIRVACEEGRDRIITHLYGHGGSGWTLCHGSVEKGIDRFCMTARGNVFNHNEPLLVLGGGVIGLLTASRLAELFGGDRVHVIAEEYHQLASHKAGGLLAPISLKTAPEAQLELNEFAHSSFTTWEQIADGDISHFRGGARRMPVYVREGSDAGLDMYVRARRGTSLRSSQKAYLLPPPVPVDVSFDTGGRYAMRRYENIFIDTQVMMRRLHAHLDSLGVERQQGRIRRLDDIDTPYIFNCTGLGARELVGDDKVEQVWGHLLGLGPQPQPHQLEYMLYADLPTESAPDGKKETCYFMPKQVTHHGLGVLGGTFTSQPLTESDHLRLLDGVQNRAVRFFDGR